MQLDQDAITEILDHVKAPKWHDSMVTTDNDDIFEIYYQEIVFYFKC
jgi:hypothetical protein